MWDLLAGCSQDPPTRAAGCCPRFPAPSREPWGPRLRRRGVASRTARQEVTLRALYDEHAAALLSYALRLTAGDRGRAEDIVQETLLRAWKHLDDLGSERGSTRAWLVTVARHVAVDAHRAR